MTAGGTEEIELKLEMTPAAAEALMAGGLFPGEPRIVQHRAIYFDTPGHDLSKAGLSLRIRSSGERRVQTVKANGDAAAGLFARPEWEKDVADDTPVLDDTTPIPSLLREKSAAVAPQFAVEIARRIWMLDFDGASIEIALDRGRAVASDRETPICEAELELKAGEPSALFALARRIDAAAAARLGVLSKAERGYRLLGPAPAAAKAGPVALAPEMTASVAFQRIAHACLRQFRLNEPLILDRGDPVALHQARVSLRRLRSALSIYKPMLADARLAPLAGELRWLAGVLGDARDLDVVMDRTDDGPAPAGLGEARAQAYASVRATLDSRRARALMIDLVEWIATGDWLGAAETKEIRETPSREFAAHVLDRFRKKVKKEGRDLADLDDESRHEVRKAAKKLRYAAEFFAALYSRKRERRRHKRFLDALEALQDQLGALNDLVAAPDVLGKLGLDADPAARSLLEGGEKAGLLDAAADAHDAFVDAKRFWR